MASYQNFFIGNSVSERLASSACRLTMYYRCMYLFPVDLQHRRGPLLPSALWVCAWCFPVLCVCGGSAWKRRTRTKKRTRKRGKKRAKRISTPKWMEVTARYMRREETPHTHTQTHTLHSLPVPCRCIVLAMYQSWHRGHPGVIKLSVFVTGCFVHFSCSCEGWGLR